MNTFFLGVLGASAVNLVWGFTSPTIDRRDAEENTPLIYHNI